MKSLTHDFEYIDSFVTLFYVGRSHHLQKSSKINILNRALQAPRLIDWNRVLTVGVHQFQSSTGALVCILAELSQYRGHFTL